MTSTNVMLRCLAALVAMLSVGLTIAQPPTSADPAAGPAGWDVNALAVHKDGTIYAGYDRGVLISVDKGARWTRASRGLPVESLDAIAVAPDGSVYVASNGIFRTVDKGRSWVPTGRRAVKGDRDLDENIVAILIVGNDIYHADGRGVYRSVDKGATWTSASRKGWTSSLSSLGVGRDGTLFAGTTSGVFKSVDKGARWTRAGDAFDEHVTQLVEAEGSMFAVAHNKGVFKSTDGGANWLAASRGLPPESAGKGTVYSLHAARDGALYAGVGLVIYKSSDKGASWVPTGPGLKRVRGWDLAYEVYVESFAETEDGTIFVGTKDGIYKSADKGAHWIRLLLLSEPPRS